MPSAASAAAVSAGRALDADGDLGAAVQSKHLAGLPLESDGSVNRSALLPACEARAQVEYRAPRVRRPAGATEHALRTAFRLLRRPR